jgi:hypothetical protein
MIAWFRGTKRDWHETGETRWREVSRGPTLKREVHERRFVDVLSDEDDWRPIYLTWTEDGPETRVVPL